MPDDPFVRLRLDAVDDVEVGSGCAAWTRTTPKGEIWATALGGDPGELSRLLGTIDGRERLDGITCPAAAGDWILSNWPGTEPGRWSLWEYAGTRVPEAPRSQAAVRLTEDDGRIRELLAHSASAYVFPGDPNVVEWQGAVLGGNLVAVGARQDDARGAAHIVSVCTAPEARGQGLAGIVVEALTVSALEQGASGVYLEMYTDNAAGAALYRRCGFREVGRYISWLVERGA